jgi:hypothetical protein
VKKTVHAGPTVTLPPDPQGRYKIASRRMVRSAGGRDAADGGTTAKSEPWLIRQESQLWLDHSTLASTGLTSLWSSLEAVELANLTGPTLAEVIDQAHRGSSGSAGPRIWPTRSCGMLA